MAPTRHERLRAGLDALGCSSAVLVGAAHTTCFAGYTRYLGGLSAVVVDEESRRTLVVPRYELEAAEESSGADDVVPYGPPGFLDFDPVPKLVAACLARVSPGRVGLAGEAGAFRDAVQDSLAVDELVRDIRLVKDADETALIARSYGLALAAQREVERLAGAGASEIELCSAALACAQNAAGSPVELISVVASGPGTASVSSPVYVPGTRRVGPGEPVLADLAVRCDGYWGDTTRTTIRGSNAEVEEARDAIAAIGRALAPLLRPGVRASEVFAEASSAILSRFPGGTFSHHAGHGIGVAVAEDPQLIPTEERALEAGMALALEPGVYFPGRFGVRVEDMVVVTPAGGRLLGDEAPAG